MTPNDTTPGPVEKKFTKKQSKKVAKKRSKKVAKKQSKKVAKKQEKIDSTPPREATLLERILWVRERVTTIGKDAFVQTGRSANVGYRAVTHDKVTAFIRPKLNQAGIIVIMTCLKHESFDTGAVTERSRKIQQFRAEYCIRFHNVYQPDDFFEIMVPAYADDSGDKGPGKAASYAMKYALLKTFMIETGEDDEERAGSPQGNTEGRAATIGDDDKAQSDVYALADELYGDRAPKKLKAMAKRRFHVDSYAEIPLDRLDDVFRALRSNWQREQQDKEKNRGDTT